MSINLLQTEHGKALMERLIREGGQHERCIVFFGGCAYSVRVEPEGYLEDEDTPDEFEADADAHEAQSAQPAARPAGSEE